MKDTLPYRTVPSQPGINDMVPSASDSPVQIGLARLMSTLLGRPDRKHDQMN